MVVVQAYHAEIIVVQVGWSFSGYSFSRCFTVYVLSYFLFLDIHQRAHCLLIDGGWQPVTAAAWHVGIQVHGFPGALSDM